MNETHEQPVLCFPGRISTVFGKRSGARANPECRQATRAAEELIGEGSGTAGDAAGRVAEEGGTG
jgi:hypothetical protein